MDKHKDPKSYPYNGENIVQCKGCYDKIYFFGKVPVDYSNDPKKRICHFINCPNANDFRSRKNK